MSHPSEARLLAYADDALHGDPRRELETHLMRCRECRARIVALGDESTFLADVLLERERPVRSTLPGATPERSVALGVPVAIAAVTAVLAVAGGLLESRLPAGLDLLHPLRLKGVSEMSFDVFFFLRDRMPGLVELFVSIGAVASLSGLLTFGVGIIYRRLFGASVALLLAAGVAAPEPARALDVRMDEDTDIRSSETVEESLLVTGDRIRIDGRVRGDLIAVAEHVQISGTIEGDVYVIGRDLDLSGTVEGNIHAVSERTRIDGKVMGACWGAVARFTLVEEASIGRDVWLLSKHAIVDGAAERDVVFGGKKLEVGGRIGRNLEARWAENVTLRDTARVGGGVEAWLRHGNEVEQAASAQIGGEVITHTKHAGHEHYLKTYTEPAFYIFEVIGFAAAGLYGLLLFWIFPTFFDVGIQTSRDFFRSLAMGFVLLVVPPFAILAVALTVVGIPIAGLALFVYLTSLYTAEILVGAWLGRVLITHEGESVFSFGRTLFVGLGLILIASHIPFIGPPIGVVCLLVGLGLLLDRARRLPMIASWG